MNLGTEAFGPSAAAYATTASGDASYYWAIPPATDAKTVFVDWGRPRPWRRTPYAPPSWRMGLPGVARTLPQPLARRSMRARPRPYARRREPRRVAEVPDG